MIKPIMGSWFEFQHHNKPEGKYWNSTCAQFTAADWDAKVKEVAELGMEYLVLMHVALDFKAYFKTDIFPHADIACYDPVDAVLTAGDKYGVKFFIGNDFFGQWDSPHIIHDSDSRRLRLRAIGGPMKHILTNILARTLLIMSTSVQLKLAALCPMAKL